MTDSNLFVVPDSIEPIRGMRNWSVQGEALHSLFLSYPWQPGVNTASCAMHGPNPPVMGDDEMILPHPERETPFKWCRCGLYFYIGEHHAWGCNCWRMDYRRFQEAPEQLLYPPLSCEKHHYLEMTGVVEGWGKIELYQEGARAQFARIIALGFAGAITRDYRMRGEVVAERYGVPLLSYSALLEMSDCQPAHID
jgi:hypothetical protein